MGDFDNYDKLRDNPKPMIIIGLGLALVAGLAKGLYELYLVAFR